VQALAEYGYKEVQLLGQNVNSYGMGRRIEGGQRLGFSALLKLVASKSMLPRIKFTTSHPRDFGPDIVQAIEEHQGLCPWVHLPPQSGSDRVLAAMNRGYTYSDYMRKAAMIRNARRDINLTADLIVGFPGETEKDFRRTLDLVREAEFDGAYMFKYSPRPGTVAARWSDGTPEPEKTERFLRLQEIQKEVQNRRDQRYLGRMVEVLVEGKSAKSESHWTGHTPCNKVVNFSSTASNVEGLIVKVEVTKINPQSLFGQQVG
jgi:tRNA-2-methylthio-N6-dimethylallyladenosine synthase